MVNLSLIMVRPLNYFVNIQVWGVRYCISLSFLIIDMSLSSGDEWWVDMILRFAHDWFMSLVRYSIYSFSELGSAFNKDWETVINLMSIFCSGRGSSKAWQISRVGVDFWRPKVYFIAFLTRIRYFSWVDWFVKLLWKQIEP